MVMLKDSSVGHSVIGAYMSDLPWFSRPTPPEWFPPQQSAPPKLDKAPPLKLVATSFEAKERVILIGFLGETTHAELDWRSVVCGDEGVVSWTMPEKTGDVWVDYRVILAKGAETKAGKYRGPTVMQRVYQ